MEQLKFPGRIRYEYEQEPGARLHYAHGVWGGINPQGEVEINFYVESDKMPAYSERRVEPDGSLGQELAPFDEEVRVVTRHIHTRVVINYHTARALLEWLEEKVDTLDMEEEGSPSFSLDGSNSSFEQ
jgi:hypothetical protein